MNIEELLSRGDLVKRNKGIVLARPIKILISSNAIRKIKEVYEPSSEKGGVMIMKPTNERGKFIIDGVRIIANKSSRSNTAFEPDENALSSFIMGTLAAGWLPLVFHTHPTKIGNNIYDSKRVGFYVGSSKPDRKIAGAGLLIDNEKILLPEAIFVKDSRYEAGYKLSFFQGGILPASYNALSKAQIIGAVLAGLSLLKWGRPLLLALAVLVGIEEYRRPKYTYFKNGSLEVEFRNVF